MKKLLLPLILLTFVLGACDQSDKVDKSFSAEQESSMPEEMPEDFAFSVQFGGNNKIDTFKNLISNRKATADITFSDKEMSEIYQKMKEINVLEKRDFGKACSVQPSEEYEWKITLNGETLNHYFVGAPCVPTKDGAEFLKLHNYVFKKVKLRKEYQELPSAWGGYVE